MIHFVVLAQLLLPVAALAQSPVSMESYQLQQLVDTSKQQLKSAKELLEYGKQDADSLQKSARILDALSAGINRSVEKYQGTPVYEEALLKLQSENLANRNQGTPAPDAEKSQKHFESFQTESIKANFSDLSDQRKLAEALRSAEQGFVPKLQTQTQLGNWQASTRVSSQLTELLSAVHGLREDMRSKSQNPGGLAELVEGADIQNQKQREVTNHGPR